MEKCSVRGCPSGHRVIVVKSDSTLEFCGHHYNEHRAVLLLDGFAVLEDTRDRGQRFEEKIS